MYIQTDEDGRILASTDNPSYAQGMFEFDMPDDFDYSHQDDWVIKDGELVYSERPDPFAIKTESLVESAVSFMLRSVSLASVPADDIVTFKELWPDWQPDTDYKQNDPIQYDEKYWRVSRDLTSSKIYPPGTSESLYYEIQLAPDGIIIYRTCHGKYDSVRLGEKRHYPDADGPIYESLVDYNAYSPDAYPKNWKLVE